jgi:uncharacterized membrane protein (UPF0127 family)
MSKEPYLTKLYLNSRLISDNVKEAKGFLENLVGLIGRKVIEDGFFLLFRKCNSIHTFFMSADIDVVMIDARGIVQSVKANLRPWKLAVCLKARDTLEMKAGGVLEFGINTGDKITFS